MFIWDEYPEFFRAALVELRAGRRLANQLAVLAFRYDADQPILLLVDRVEDDEAARGADVIRGSLPLENGTTVPARQNLPSEEIRDFQERDSLVRRHAFLGFE
jgi:hypothetical protein